MLELSNLIFNESDFTFERMSTLRTLNDILPPAKNGLVATVLREKRMLMFSIKENFPDANLPRLVESDSVYDFYGNRVRAISLKGVLKGIGNNPVISGKFKRYLSKERIVEKGEYIPKIIVFPLIGGKYPEYLNITSA